MIRLLKALAIAALAYAPTGATAQDRVEIEGESGKLVALIQKPELKEGEKCPMVIMCHGFMGNKGGRLFEAIADSLQKEGIASIRFDFDGHGESDGKFVDMTVPKEINDAKCVYNYVLTLPYVNTNEIGILGHSQGGVVSAMTAGDLGAEKIKAAVLLAPAAVLREDALRGNTMGRAYNPHNVPEEGVKMFGDLVLGHDYIVTAQTLPIYETAAKYKGKGMVMHGTYDVVVPYTFGERFHYVWPGSELVLMPGVDHGFSGKETETAGMAATFFKSAL